MDLDSIMLLRFFEKTFLCSAIKSRSLETRRVGVRVLLEVSIRTLIPVNSVTDCSKSC